MAGTGEGARWTLARRRQFLAALAISADAGLAAQAVGETLWAAQALRRRDRAFGEAWDEAIGAAHALVEEGLLRRMLALLAAGEAEEGGEAGAGTAGLSITPPLAPPEVQLYLKLLARRDALARAGDSGNDAARASAAETDAALERALDGLARRRLKGMA